MAIVGSPADMHLTDAVSMARAASGRQQRSHAFFIARDRDRQPAGATTDDRGQRATKRIALTTAIIQRIDGDRQITRGARENGAAPPSRQQLSKRRIPRQKNPSDSQPTPALKLDLCRRLGTSMTCTEPSPWQATNNSSPWKAMSIG
jgi:hypothetical protein